MDSYDRGFMDKCAEMGVDPVELMKAAQLCADPDVMREITRSNPEYGRELLRTYGNQTYSADDLRRRIDSEFSNVRDNISRVYDAGKNCVSSGVDAVKQVPGKVNSALAAVRSTVGPYADLARVKARRLINHLLYDGARHNNGGGEAKSNLARR